MNPRMSGVILWLIVVLGMSATGFAQSSDVTFQVPLNLTRLSSDLNKVAVFCEITSDALPRTAGMTVGRAQKQVELTPTNGQLVQPAVAVVVPIASLDTSSTRTANYKCTLSGFSQSLQRWSPFGDSQTLPAVFRLSPAPADLSGNFTW